MALQPSSFEAILRRCGAWNEALFVMFDAADPRCVLVRNSQLIMDLSPERHRMHLGTSISNTTNDGSLATPIQNVRASGLGDATLPSHYLAGSTDRCIQIPQNAPNARWMMIPSAIPSGSGVGVANAVSYVAVVNIATGTATTIMGTSLSTGAGRPSSALLWQSTGAVRVEIDGGAASQTFGVTSSNTATSGNWVFAAGSAKPGSNIVRNGSTTTTNTNANSNNMDKDSGTSFLLGASIDDAAPSTVTSVTSMRIMMCAGWFNYAMPEEQMKAIQREVAAWRVGSLAV